MIKHEQLLYIYDIVSHGSTYPKTNISGASSPSEKGLNGLITPFGIRQMYLRGREMRNRFIENRQFLSPVYNPNEVNGLSIDEQSSVESAQAHLAGLFY